jgi:hypothetical protein
MKNSIGHFYHYTSDMLIIVHSSQKEYLQDAKSKATLLSHTKGNHFIQKDHRLFWTRNPSRCTCRPCLEVVPPTAKELVTNVQCACRFHAPEPLLAALYTKALVANIDEDVVTAIEGAEWYPTLDHLRRHLNDLLYDEHSLLKLFSSKFAPRFRVDTNRTFFAQNLGGKM